MNRHVLPRFGSVMLRNPRRGAVQEWVDDLAITHSPQTAREAHKAFRRALQAAVQRDLIPVNPAMAIRLPKVIKRPHRVLTPAEVERMAEAAGEVGFLVRFIAWAGLRFGEVAALRVKHINLLKGTLRVQEQVSRAISGRHVSELKTEAAKREIALPRFLLEDLKMHLARKGPEDLMFPTPHGGFLHAGNFHVRVWGPVLQQAEVAKPWPRVHDVRHTAVPLAIQAGPTPKRFRPWLATATPDHHGRLRDVMPGMGDALASRMDQLRETALGWQLVSEVSEVLPLRAEKGA
jgi:integrase